MATMRNSLGQVIAYEETTYGVAPAGPGLRARLISHSFTENKNMQVSPEIRAGRQPGKPYKDGSTVSGSITILADPVDLGFWLKWGVGVPVTTGAGPFTHTYKADETLTSLTLELLWTGAAKIWLVTGAMIQSFSIDIGTSGMLQLTINFMASVVSQIPLASRIDAAPYQAAADRIMLRGSTIGITDADPPTSVPHISRFQATVNNQIEGYEAIPAEGFHEITEGVLQVNGSATVLIKDDDPFWGYHDAEDEVTIEADLTSEAAATVQLRVPESLVSMAMPQIGGQTGATMGQLTWQAYQDDAADASAVVFVLVNPLAAYTAIPAA